MPAVLPRPAAGPPCSEPCALFASACSISPTNLNEAVLHLVCAAGQRLLQCPKVHPAASTSLCSCKLRSRMQKKPPAAAVSCQRLLTASVAAHLDGTGERWRGSSDAPAWPGPTEPALARKGCAAVASKGPPPLSVTTCLGVRGVPWQARDLLPARLNGLLGRARHAAVASKELLQASVG